ncbi:TonB-dependent siderophore receptor [Undibacterium baiyunense]|uniref:TonB-dependent siderophore receptor n=1 Tax=Undibacterium baiyunense TaxID=2828731 RepID=A0A941DE41_9BURK|nr:TonB-dependent siderophore receptor [Undibacterium baiyunense]MBR7747054.1 TonB-dependent siderophore receptor [Undibacterium baiyunense]
MSNPRFRFSLITIAITQLLAVASSASAQSQEQTLQEVVVSASRSNKVDTSKANGFIANTLQDTPATLNVFSASQLQDLRVRQTSDAMKFDASVSDAYNAVGYAEQFSIRGFTLDNSSSYRKDGFAILGDASIPLENKERLEILKGISGLQSGFTTPGGIINYVTKRPTNSLVRSTTLEASERGTLYGTVDLGGKTDNKQFGYRINAAIEKLRSYVKGADGERQFAGFAFNWQINPQALFQIDADYQHKSQISVPGFQLFDGKDLPRGIKADMMLNNQKWVKPVDTKNSNLGLRFEYQINQNWTTEIAANAHEFKRDDFTAFPYGCRAQELFPGYCANGDYDVYDYQSPGESKKLRGIQAIVSGNFATGELQHRIAFGVNHSQRRDYYGNYVYDYAGSSNLFRPMAVPPSSGKPGPVLLRRTDKELSAFIQDIVKLNQEFDLHFGLRHLDVDRTQLGSPNFSQSYNLPNVALVYKATPTTNTYLSLSEGLEHGGVAPIGTSNENKMLDAGKSKQIEFGVKSAIARDLNVSAAIFRITKPLEYTNAANMYVSTGEAEHRGLEIAAQGNLATNWILGLSATALNARQNNTGDANIEGKRVTNVPNFKSTIYTDYAPAAWSGTHLTASWQYSGSKAFSPDNKVSVPAFNVVNLGARYTTQIQGVVSTFRFDINNAFNKFYWRDVTQSLGGYLFPGAPRTYKISGQFDF